MLNSVLIQTGTVNGNAVMVDVSHGVGGGYPGAVRVVMAAGMTYTMSAPPAYPVPPFLSGSGPGAKFYPGVTFGPGTVMDLLQPEAVALVSGGFATLVGME
jgi:hypothetical protein